MMSSGKAHNVYEYQYQTTSLASQPATSHLFLALPVTNSQASFLVTQPRPPNASMCALCCGAAASKGCTLRAEACSSTQHMLLSPQRASTTMRHEVCPTGEGPVIM